ncbi:MAG: D-aminoacyl-tRNA deacylase [Acidaminococcaceae bacterium]
MRAVVQRVESAAVTVGTTQVGAIRKGLLVLLGVAKSDTVGDLTYLANKIINLRIFEDDQGKMNESILAVAGELLVVSQFTLYGDCRKGRRPAFDEAAGAELAKSYYEQFTAYVASKGLKVATGQFQAHMLVSLVNNGPVTILLDSNKNF